MGCCKSTQFYCCIAVDHDESVVLNKPTGKEIRHGAGWFFFPNWWEATVVKPIVLKSDQYLIVQHMITDNKNSHSRNPDQKQSYKKTDDMEMLTNENDTSLLEVIRGPLIYRRSNAYDRVSEIKQMFNITPTQFIIILDKLTGKKRVEAGPQLFCPQPYDEISGLQNMYNLSSTQYIIVTDETTGDRKTVTGLLNK